MLLSRSFLIIRKLCTCSAETPLSILTRRIITHGIPTFVAPFTVGMSVDTEGVSKRLFTSKYEDNLQRSDETVLSKTSSWIDRVVVGLNLCPFAERSIKLDQLKLDVVRGKDEEEIISSVFFHIMSLSSPERHGTAIVIAPDIFENDFLGFIDFIQYIEEMMFKLDLDDDIQLAPFHPQFEFAEEEKNKISTFTNKSPYPMIHILRDSEVSAAVNQLDGDASRVWKRNIKLLESLEEQLGSEKIKKWLINPSLNDRETKVAIDFALKDIKINGYEN